jgi:hypothetical protein
MTTTNVSKNIWLALRKDAKALGQHALRCFDKFTNPKQGVFCDPFVDLGCICLDVAPYDAIVRNSNGKLTLRTSTVNEQHIAFTAFYGTVAAQAVFGKEDHPTADDRAVGVQLRAIVSKFDGINNRQINALVIELRRRKYHPDKLLAMSPLEFSFVQTELMDLIETSANKKVERPERKSVYQRLHLKKPR